MFYIINVVDCMEMTFQNSFFSNKRELQVKIDGFSVPGCLLQVFVQEGNVNL